MTHSRPKIRIENLIKIYGTNCAAALELLGRGVNRSEVLNATGQVAAVAGVSLAIKQGEFVVLMGLSGSGKSTLLRSINRLVTPSSGHIYIDDEDIVAFDKNRLRQLRLAKISMVFQHFGLFPHKTVVANVEYGLKVQGKSPAERRKRALEVLETMKLAKWADHKPSALSGGMKQRVGLARALATDAEILLMDEPFSALDPPSRREMQVQLLEIQSSLRKTIVFVTHDANEALQLGDRIAVLREGALVEFGTPDELAKQPANSYVHDLLRDANRMQAAIDQDQYPLHARAGI